MVNTTNLSRPSFAKSCYNRFRNCRIDSFQYGLLECCKYFEFKAEIRLDGIMYGLDGWMDDMRFFVVIFSRHFTRDIYHKINCKYFIYFFEMQIPYQL